MTKLHSIQQIAAFFASACLGAFAVGPAAVSLAGNTQIWMPIATGTVSIVSTPTVVFPSTMSSASSQSVTVSPGLFTVEDLGGKYEGYYVTVSSSDLVNGATTVDNANVMVTVTGATVTTLAGNPNAAVLVPATAGEVGAGYVNLDSPRLLLARA